MYLHDSKLDRANLCQGDILSLVHVLGALNYGNIVTVGTVDNVEAWQVKAPPRIADVMVLSHSCELAQENDVKVTSIILVPMRDVHKATKPAKVQDLINSNFVRSGTGDQSFLKYFYVEPNILLEHSGGAIADFSKCFSVRKQSYNFLLNKKVLQLKSEVVDEMALKLALYFHRSQQQQPEPAATVSSQQ